MARGGGLCRRCLDLTAGAGAVALGGFVLAVLLSWVVGEFLFAGILLFATTWGAGHLVLGRRRRPAVPPAHG